MEAIGIGDLHFDGPLANLIPNHAQQIYIEVCKVLKWGESRGINNIIFYGDLCERPRMSYESHLCLFKILNNAKFNFHLMVGNHDKMAKESSVGHSLQLIQDLVKNGMWPHVRVYTEDTKVKIDGAPVKFLPWPSTKFSKTCLNVAHTEVYGSKSDSGRVFDKDTFSKSKSVVVSGHLHTPHKIRKTFFSGTLFQHNFGEGLKKGFHHINFNSVDDYSIDWIPHDPDYKLYNVVIESKSDLKRASRNPKDLLKLIIEDGADIDPTQWASWPNVVKVTPFKTKDELVTALTEDIKEGSSLELDTDDYVDAWIENQNLDQDQLADIKRVRSKLFLKEKRNGSEVRSNRKRAGR